ncbi:hypothetical protein NDU88_004497 [Pleurodeles waltl]|uniref:Uncharacterized protein n=1 Tax=Pleurodeles waltl TaxID=8319 RepID=A0AAV7PG74_PLEWA|nr:hypothetical protein NDU88_004497 [Pleurodeles waltl]
MPTHACVSLAVESSRCRSLGHLASRPQNKSAWNLGWVGERGSGFRILLHCIKLRTYKAHHHRARHRPETARLVEQQKKQVGIPTLTGGYNAVVTYLRCLGLSLLCFCPGVLQGERSRREARDLR